MSEVLLSLDNPRVLVTNDDGIGAPGLKILEKVANSLSDDVWIVAPLTEQSAASHSLTLRRPLRILKKGEKRYVIDGTPTDCVLLSVNQIMKECLPDLVLSGVNQGRNVGEDMTYSGTIAAAMEATLFGIPAIALSQDMSDEDHRNHGGDIEKKYSSAQGYAAEVIKSVTKVAWPRDVLINVNFPRASKEEVVGIEVTRQGRNKIGDEVLENKDPKEDPYYWIGPRRNTNSHPPGTDINALQRGLVSITPISLDLTDEPTIKILESLYKNNNTD